MLISSCSNKLDRNDISRWLEPNNLNNIDSTVLKKQALDYFITGSKYKSQRKYPKSIIEYQQALKYDSSDIIKYSLAQSYKEYEKYDLAEEMIGQILNNDPNFLMGLELLAEIKLYRFKINDAIEIYRKLIELEEKRDYKITLGRLYEYKSDATAIEVYEEVIEEEYSFPIMSRLSNLYLSAGDSSNYVNSLFAIHENSPGNLQNSLSIIEYLINNEKYIKLEQFLSEINSELSSEDLLTCYSNIAQYLLDTPNNYQNEFKSYYVSSINKLFYFDWRINLMSGFIAESIEKNETAEQLIDHSAKYLEGDFPNVPLQIALFYFRQEKDKKAAEILTNFFKKYQKNWFYPYYISIAYTNLENYPKALKFIEEAEKIDKNNVEIITHKAYIYDLVDMINESDSLYIRALELDPTNPMANNNFAYSLASRNKDLKKAQTMVQIAMEYDSLNSAYLDTFGYIKYKMGEYRIALKYIKKAVENDNASAEVYENLGDVYLKLSEFENAADAFRKSLEIEPGRSSAFEKLKQIED